MNNKIKLQMRMATNNKSPGYHKVYQIIIPIALIRELGWRKGNTLLLKNTPSGINIRKGI